MVARLYVTPGSHPSMTARLMVERKGLECRRVDLISGVHKAVLRALGFPAATVPAMRLDGRRVQGTREIARALDDVAPEPPLLPADPAARAAVEQAERWGDDVLQPVPRRLAWWALKRDRSGVRGFLEGARLGLPVGLAARTALPLIWLSARLNRADDAAARADLAALGGLLDRVDELLGAGVIGSDAPNAADFQIATSVRLLLCFDDLRPAIEPRPAAAFSRRICPDFPGRVGPILTTEERQAAGLGA